MEDISLIQDPRDPVSDPSPVERVDNGIPFASAATVNATVQASQCVARDDNTGITSVSGDNGEHYSQRPMVTPELTKVRFHP